MSVQPKIYITEADYLEAERSSPEKHEYYRGEIFAMSGTSYKHNLISSNLQDYIRPHLRNSKKCRIFTGDLRVYVPHPHYYTYPDLFIICGEPQFSDVVKDTITNPKVIIEILSESTANYDRNAKFGLYRFAASLTEYILVDQYSPKIEIFRKIDDFNWHLPHVLKMEDSLRIDSIELEIPVKDIYEDIEF